MKKLIAAVVWVLLVAGVAWSFPWPNSKGWPEAQRWPDAQNWPVSAAGDDLVSFVFSTTDTVAQDLDVFPSQSGRNFFLFWFNNYAIIGYNYPDTGVTLVSTSCWWIVLLASSGCPVTANIQTGFDTDRDYVIEQTTNASPGTFDLCDATGTPQIQSWDCTTNCSEAGPGLMVLQVDSNSNWNGDHKVSCVNYMRLTG